MNILFVCSKNQWRSPTAAFIYKGYHDHNVKSAGTEPSARIRIGSKLLNWADLIFCMEKKHKERLMENFPEEMQNKDVVVLDIPDEYQYMDPELVNMIKICVDPYLCD